MDRTGTSTEKAKTRWFIALDWHQRNNRSFFALANDCLCAKCRKQLSAEEKEITEAELITTIKDCCSSAPEFITSRLPVLESIFRLFLANGNQPLTLGGLGNQLNERLSGDTYRTSEEMLSRLLKNDQYYGIRPVTD